MLFACSKKKEESVDSGLLEYIPADTPYVMVTKGQLPDDLYDKLKPQIDLVLASYRQTLRAIATSAAADVEERDGDVESVRKANAVIEELDELLSIEGLEAVGIDRRSHVAMFGQGLLPVFRLTLTDGALLEAQLAKLESSAGESMSTGNIDGHSYRYVADDDWRVIIAIIGNHFIATIAPNSFDDEQLKAVLGLTLPARSIADSTRLTEISHKYEFDDFMIGVIDIEKIVATFTDEPTGINAALLEMADPGSEPLEEVCKNEIRALAGIMPRIVTGYTELSVKRIESKAVLELRDDIATGIETFSGTVPGLGRPHDGLFAFGMSFDLLAMREFYSGRLDALEADPFECELFAELQAGVAQGREILKQPVPPIAYQFNGFLADVKAMEGMDLANNVPPTSIAMRLLVATENAEGLLAMGAMFSPDIAALNLQPDGDPVLLDIPQIQATGQTVHVALSETALALSAGDGMQDGLTAMLNAPVTEPSPFVSIDIDASSYHSLVSESIATTANDELAQMPELKEALEDLMAASADMFSRFRVDINLTEHGVEFATSATLKDK
jgi:hypothetical protein